MPIVKINHFWAKARPIDRSDAPMHPVVAHSLDVAAVAMLLPGARALGLDRRAIGLLVSLHDIGKFSRAFQAQAPDSWPSGVLGPYPDAPPRFPHDAMGLHLLDSLFDQELQQAVAPDAKNRRLWALPLLGALAGHHGRPAYLQQKPTADHLCDICVGAARSFVASMLDVFGRPVIGSPGNEIACTKLGWQVAGLVTLADWVGSRQRWFPYVTPDKVTDPSFYLWNHALPQAAYAIEAAGLGLVTPSTFGGVRGLFPLITTLTPIQGWAETVSLPPGPVLAVVEDLTGSGKTEAAMTLTHRLMAENRADGLYVALPTMATANAMFGRLSAAYRTLFRAENRPSLVLAHGRADLDPRFRSVIAADGADRGAGAHDPEREPAEAHCASWLAENSRRALLAQIGVGTIDQALLSVLPVRHATLRQYGLAGKVLLVDEVHAYDAYMTRELVTLLRFHAAFGGSVILLSATLPQALRQKLTDAFRSGLQVPPAPLSATTYPLATLVAGDAVSETPCAPRDGLPRRVTVIRIADQDAMIARIVVVAQHAAVAWIRNTVDDAIEAANALRALGYSPLLFHARFAMADRLEIEAEVLRRFGPEGDPCNRPGILIATQVIEQSLDLDFDLLCTDLAPVDLLIQRAGRLWRHRRPPEARQVAGPELLVLSPDPVSVPSSDWISATQPGTAAIYRDTSLLWRTARCLFERGAIETPNDMRPLIEHVFDGDSPGQTPPALAAAADAAQGRNHAAGSLAAQNLLDLRKGYHHDAGLWERDTRTPTRLEEREQVTVRLALVEDGVIVPYAADPDPRRAWSLSEVSVSRSRLGPCPAPAGLETAATQAKQSWGRWERESDRHVLAVMQGTRADFRKDRFSATICEDCSYDRKKGFVVGSTRPAKRE